MGNRNTFSSGCLHKKERGGFSHHAERLRLSCLTSLQPDGWKFLTQSIINVEVARKAATCRLVQSAASAKTRHESSSGACQRGRRNTRLSQPLCSALPDSRPPGHRGRARLRDQMGLEGKRGRGRVRPQGWSC